MPATHRPAPSTSALRSLLAHAAVAALMSFAWAGVLVIRLALQPQGVPAAEAALAFWRSAGLDFAVVGVMMAAAALGVRRLPAHGPARQAALAAVVLAATLLGTAVYLALQRLVASGALFGWVHLPHLPYLLFRHGALALLLVALREATGRRREADEALHQAELRALALDRELGEARLALLQAQVEPHFLFNSLANVRRLLRTEPAAASRLLGALLRYLEEALPRLRDATTTLGREAELVRAFLAVHRVRMGDRLHAEVSVPDELQARAVPPMMLLTLVENAIKHGLQPRIDGGSIHVDARAGGGLLTLTVADTGQGMGSAMGHGNGLANLRARLKALYGSAAAFSLRLNEPRGVVAVITLPDHGA